MISTYSDFVEFIIRDILRNIFKLILQLPISMLIYSLEHIVIFDLWISMEGNFVVSDLFS